MKELACQRLFVFVVLALGSAVSECALPAAAGIHLTEASDNSLFCSRRAQLASSEVLRQSDRLPLDVSRCDKAACDMHEPACSRRLSCGVLLHFGFAVTSQLYDLICCVLAGTGVHC